MTDLKPIRNHAPQVEIVLSIIISCYNTRDLVLDCLRSIYQNPARAPYEVILVDDASGDGTSEMVSSAFPEVRLLRSDTNRHYARSNNWALDHARGRYVLLLNNDTLVLPRALDDMIAFLQGHPDAGAVGCKLLNEDGTIQWSVKSLPNLARDFRGPLDPGQMVSEQPLFAAALVAFWPRHDSALRRRSSVRRGVDDAAQGHETSRIP